MCQALSNQIKKHNFKTKIEIWVTERDYDFFGNSSSALKSYF